MNSCNIIKARWFAFISFFLASIFFHLKVSNFLVTPIATPFGDITLINHTTAISWVVLCALALFLFVQASAGKKRIATFLYWTLWIITVIFTDKFLLYKGIEYIHYPQYAILAIFLTFCLDPRRENFLIGKILFWITTLGILDEMNQYFFLCSSYGDYLDFNDFYLNLQGAMAGVLLVYGFRTRDNSDNLVANHKQSTRSTYNLLRSTTGSIEGRFVLVVLLILLLLTTSGRLKMTPPDIVPPGGTVEVHGKTVVYIERQPRIMGGWNGGEHRKLYYVLSPMGGTTLLLVTGFIFSSFGIFLRRI